MKKIYFLLLLGCIAISFLSSHNPLSYNRVNSEECYISCYTTEVREQFRLEAQQASFAAMHPLPRKYEITHAEGKRITFKASDGTEAFGYEIRSAQPSNQWLFVIQEWWGLNNNIIREAEEYAAALGNVNVLALDMYDGKVASTPDSAVKLVQSAKPERLEKIVLGGIQYAGSSAHIFTIGWCFGGMWSLQSSILAGKQAAGCVMYYGKPENNIQKLQTLQCDVLGIFGTLDRSPTPEVVRKFEADMQTAGKKLSLNFYEAGHGFANPSNPGYQEAFTADARKKSLAFIRERLQ
ncbi:MAG: dienelactone hydrolase family protein [Sediminibacterium sp.]|nr:dienelactone hydrolase family protein [Sediminibacterium sp.]